MSHTTTNVVLGPRVGALRSERGLGEILKVLGRPTDAWTRSVLLTVFVVTTLAAAAAAQVVRLTVALPAPAIQAALWIAWLTWHSLLFPRARRRALARGAAHAYRAVFPTHILPGVCIGVSLMGGPGLHAVLGGAPLAPPDQLAFAAVWLVAGTALLVSGFTAIGLASAGFLYEYVDAPQPIAVRGVYRFLRHPLFLGGVVASVGPVLMFETTASLVAVNVAVLPAYRLLEDRRLSGVFGSSYRAYCREVAAFVPRVRALQAAAGR